jgi:lysophospholipase L1-like esterase
MKSLVAILACLLAGMALAVSAAPPPAAAKKKSAAAATKKKAAPKAKAKSTGAAKKAPASRKPVNQAYTYQHIDRESALKWIQESMEPQQETFDNVRGLVPFFEQLYQSSKTKSPVHVLHYGDSHTASDDWPNSMRQFFQERFGNGGPGFAFAGRPYRGYRRFDMQSNSSDTWVTEGTLQRRGDPMQGLGGVSITSVKPGETVTFSGTGEESELLFLQHPEGGAMEVWVDDNLLGTVSTVGELRPATLPLAEVPGPHKYMLKTLTPEPVRLFGTVIQNKSGITWETMGINGAYAPMIGDWDEGILSAHLAKRKPALIVLAYGTNEANGPRWDGNDYYNSLKKVVTRFRSAAPTASILIVGPPDCNIHWVQNLDAVINIQLKVAAETGATFWHWRDRMGGPGSMRYWVAAGLAQGDYIHMTSPGYELVGKTLAQELFLQYQRFLNARSEVDQ